MLPAPVTLLGAGLIGFLGYGVSLTLFVPALRRLGTARTEAYFSTAPFIGRAVAVGLFGDPITARLLGAALLMAIGITLHLLERHEHEHVHDEMVHEHAHVHDAHHQHPTTPEDPPGEPHLHLHRHPRLVHRHPHHPDLHYRREHAG